jgi:hypothetical protein
MIDVVSFLPSKRKHTSSGWISFNAPCCVHRGDNQDKRQRGGLKTNSDGSWSYHCFNCQFTASFVLGRTLSFKARSLLKWLGVDQLAIEQLNLESLRHRSIYGILEDEVKKVKKIEIKFEEKTLPDSIELLDYNKHQKQWEYLKSRSIDPTSYPYMTDSEKSIRPRVLIPFTHEGKIVGNTSRYLDNRTPKYINDTQPGYVFGWDLQQEDWQYAIVVEGIFDALSINGLAVMHNDINPTQAQLIKNLERSIIVVPDQDQAGITLIDRAIELGWAVSVPNWPEGIKDVNDAVVKLGRVATLLIILQAKETSKIKIELRKKQLAKRLRN